LPEARWFGSSCHRGLRSETVLGFDFGRRAVVELAVQSLLVEPRHLGAGGDLEVVEALPGAAVGGECGRVAVQRGLESPMTDSAMALIEAVADRGDGRCGSHVLEALGVGN
jgi:hypothetical protein